MSSEGNIESNNDSLSPVVLTIAGSDCSGGAGIQADLKTFAYFQTYGLSAVTAVVAEVPGKLSACEAVSPGILTEQLTILKDTYPICSVKTGMLATAQLCEVVARFLEDLGQAEETIPVVIDPVFAASAGESLCESEAMQIYRQRLLPQATLVTPNLAEAAALLDIPEISRHEDMDEAARKISGSYQCMTLVKGGHLDGSDSTDILWDGTSIHDFSTERVRGKNPHGTGCTFSAAITALLAHDYPLLEAVHSAKEYITAAIRQSIHPSISIGDIDTLNHFPNGID